MKIEYYPWTEEVLQNTIDVFMKGGLPCIDLEFGAKCNHKIQTSGCIYCDSYDRVGQNAPNELTKKQLLNLVDQGIGLGLRWVYVCGLGEPKDDSDLKAVVKHLSRNKMGISMFSNGIGYSEEDVTFLHENKVNLIVKCDSLNPSVFNQLLGGKKASENGVAESIYKTIGSLIECGYSQHPEEPDLALSIVPTELNLLEIPRVIEFCKKWSLFPLIGELESAGRASKGYAKLAPSNEQLETLRRDINNILGYNYDIPLCPAAFAGLHISNTGECLVHEQSGLSCPWFSLLEPRTKILGTIQTSTLVELRSSLIKYRECLKESGELSSFVQKFVKGQHHVFGGCGGLKLMQLLMSTYMEK